MKKIAEGKAFFMKSKQVKETFLFLTRVRSSPGAFADLPCSVSDAAEFYRAEEGSSTEKLFWSQYTGTEHPRVLERPAEAVGRTSQGDRIGHEGPYSPDVVWRALVWQLLRSGEAAGGSLPTA